MFAVQATSYGWSVLQIRDGQATTVANVGPNQQMAEQIRDYLIHQDRIDTLLARHGLHDVPLDQLGEP